MIPSIVTAKAAIKSFWVGSKWIILVSVLAFSHYWAYKKGETSVYKDSISESSKSVQREIDRGVKAVETATKDTVKVKDTERSNDEDQRRFDELVNRSRCSFTDDELLLIEEVVKGTGGG